MLGVGRAGPTGPAARVAASTPDGARGGAAAAGVEVDRAHRSAAAAGAVPARDTAGLAARTSRGGQSTPGAVPGPRLGEREAWTAVAAVEGLGPVTFGMLLGAFGSARSILAVAGTRRGPARLVAAAAAGGLRMTDDVVRGLVGAQAGWPALAARLAANGVVAVTAEDDGYPGRLRAIELPPPVLFVRGDAGSLAAPRTVAIVGTRRPTDDGRRVAGRIGSAVAAAGAVVVSGLAIGIDGAAHAGALAAGGRSVAVLGSGHARLYPAAHAPLADEIVRTGGAVVAELPPDAGPTAAGFPRRNRIIAGLAEATIVVEAGERSGALITASWALEQGRGVFVVPGPLDRPQSVGCNRLLRSAAEAARIVAGTDELLEDLGYGVPLPVRAIRRDRAASTPAEAGAIVARLAPIEAATVVALFDGPRTADDIAGRSDVATATVLAVLTRLEEQGLVHAAFGRYRLAGPLADARRVAPPTRRQPEGDAADGLGGDP